MLARQADQVIAVDLSPKMVEFGRELALRHDLPNLEYRLGDIEEPPLEDASVDLAFLSQALHHAGSPEKALLQAFRIVKPGGRLVVLDLLQHNFEQARELYADVWLGFSEGELAAMLEKAGFVDIETAVVDREPEPPNFQTLLAVAKKPA
jgi:ubiquinone/menaquinone biosynthesis C-methylase UbiE